MIFRPDLARRSGEQCEYWFILIFFFEFFSSLEGLLYSESFLRFCWRDVFSSFVVLYSECLFIVSNQHEPFVAIGSRKKKLCFPWIYHITWIHEHRIGCIWCAFCPSLGTMVHGERSKPLCCSYDSIMKLSKIHTSIGGPDPLTARSYNFMQLLCQIACSANQRDFIHVIEPSHPMLTSVEYFFSTEFSDKVFESSRNLKESKIGCGQCGKTTWFIFISYDFYQFIPYRISSIAHHRVSDPLVIDNKTYHPLCISTATNHENDAGKIEIHRLVYCEPAFYSSSFPVGKSSSTLLSNLIMVTIMNIICIVSSE